MKWLNTVQLILMLLLFSLIQGKNLQLPLVSSNHFECPNIKYRENTWVDNLIKTANSNNEENRVNYLVEQIPSQALLFSSEQVVRILTEVKLPMGLRLVLQTLYPYIFRLSANDLRTILNPYGIDDQKYIVQILKNTLLDVSLDSKNIIISAFRCKSTGEELINGIQPRDCFTRVEDKNLIIVFDISASMTEKFKFNGNLLTRFDFMKPQLIDVVNNLTDGNQFNILVFSTANKKWKADLVPATKENKANALSFIDTLVPRGGTNTMDAVKEALSSKYPHLSILFITDGYPSIGVTNNAEIISQVKVLNEERDKQGLGKAKINMNLLINLGGNDSPAARVAARTINEQIAQVTGGTFTNFHV